MNTDPSLLFPYFSVQTTNYNLVGGVTSQVAKLNPQRVALMMGTTGSQAIVLSPLSTVQGNIGMMISNNTTRLELTFAEWGALVGSEWYAFSASGGINLHVIEVFYRPNGG